jgi:small subunit ribosomal protein S13
VEFRYIVRVAATEMQGKTPIKLALTKIKGVGAAFANATITILGIDPHKRVGDFTNEELGRIETFLKNPEGVPQWALNRRNDPFTGKDTHLISSDLTIQLKQDLDYMKKTKSYRGMRHAFGLKVRGQRTKSTGRKGKTLGVHRKALKQQAKAKKKEGSK